MVHEIDTKDLFGRDWGLFEVKICHITSAHGVEYYCAVKEEFNWDTQAVKLLALYEDISCAKNITIL